MSWIVYYFEKPNHPTKSGKNYTGLNICLHTVPIIKKMAANKRML